MSVVEDNLAALGLSVPDVATPAGSYVPALRHGDLVYTSGQIPVAGGELQAVGKVGAEVSAEDAAACAQTCVLNALAAVKAVIGDLDKVTQVVKVLGFVASDPAFDGQPGVINGASDLIGKAFGDKGAHARSAVGVAVLPKNVPVEVEIVVAVQD
ncbi:RidA family protein [Luteipulveratus sp. YIM 133132]|uniref:RidA family protein n=1 Tax=Luteipulveratus flavus TaxID=3031728 RepID=A0ABT6C7R0_9MICO|nr:MULTISPECIES: RidA family protein [unclassified Luteipulveratus]MDE9365741.1 RidA family protein [Luteipulveratus sp. YIM 133132]MDF8264820.1 RidA family protein [Luteipulveratus sp. YIM 133296]